MTFPNDDQFEETTIAAVEAHDSGYEIQRSDHWSLWVPMYDGGKPKVGDTIRIYGKGIGHAFRGIYIDGVKVFYRTTEEDEEHQEIQRYGADAADWLSRWDEGRGVWSIEMGGLGPGYEQCIQILCAETLRFLLKTKPDLAAMEADNAAWKAFRSEMDKDAFANPVIERLGLSGAQAGAGMSLALQFYRKGPRGVMNDEAVKDRHIQVSRNFPQG